MLENPRIDDLNPNTNIDYHVLNQEKRWKVDFIEKLIEVRAGYLEVQVAEHPGIHLHKLMES